MESGVDYENPWEFVCGTLLTDDLIKEFYGMVYLIYNEIDKKRYIGKKFFWKKAVRSVKGKKKRVTVPSDWKDYYGSSKGLLEDIEKHGKENFHRLVLHLCISKTECAYLEMKEQIQHEALLREDYYNDFIGGKVNGRNLRATVNKREEMGLILSEQGGL